MLCKLQMEIRLIKRKIIYTQVNYLLKNNYLKLRLKKLTQIVKYNIIYVVNKFIIKSFSVLSCIIYTSELSIESTINVYILM